MDAKATRAGGSRVRRPDRERSRARILDAAYKLFTKRGFAATTITQIAEDAGVAKGLVLFHFRTKEEVFHGVIRRAIPALLANLERVDAADARSASQLLADALRQVYVNLVQHPEAGAILRLLVAEGPRLASLRTYYHDEVVARGTAVMTKIVQIGVQRGEFSIEMSSVEATRNVARVLLGPLILALFWQLLFARVEPLNIDGLCELHIQMALRGLVRRS
jgi:AcrR family transcriptional regulator